MKKIVISLIVLFVIIVGLLIVYTELVENNECSEEDSTPKTISVGADGDYPTIQEALDASNPSDTIQVQTGTYTESLTINKQITLIGSNPDNVFIDGAGIGHVIKIESNGVTISGFTIRGSSYDSTDATHDYTPSAIRLDGFNNCEITNNIVSNNCWGIYLLESSGNYISNNVITSNDAHGIRLWESNSNQIINNLITNNLDGMLLGRSNNNIITDNNISSNGADGIGIAGSDSNHIRDNIISSNHRHGILIQAGAGIEIDSKSNTILRNNITLNGQHGIYLICPEDNTGVTGNQIIYNTIQNNNAHGVTNGEIRNTCSGNTIENND